jgi:hypothetical protein
MKKRFLMTQLLALAVILFFCGISVSESKEMGVKLTRPDSLVTLEASDAPVEEVIDQLSKKIGFRYHLFPEIKGRHVSAHFQKQPLQKAVNELFENNCILKYNDDGTISAVYALDLKDRKLENRNRRVKSYFDNVFFALPELKDLVYAGLRKDYPTAREFLLIPREDVRGKLKAYVFSFYIGTGPAPTLEGVQLEAERGWLTRRQTAIQAKEKASTNDTTDRLVTRIPPLGAYKSMRRSHDFITLEVSADFSSPPIKKFHLGLPDDLTMYPAAKELLAKRVSNSTEFSFIRTMMISPVAIGFEFRHNISRQSYFVDVLKRQVFVSWEETKKTITRKRMDTERDSRIERQWLEMISF